MQAVVTSVFLSHTTVLYFSSKHVAALQRFKLVKIKAATVFEYFKAFQY